MRKIFVLLFLSVVSYAFSARVKDKQPYPGGKFTIYRLTLKDKKGTEGSLKHPEYYLSAKALQRRQRQGLTVDSTDLPISATYLQRLKSQKVEVIGKSKWNNTVLVKTTDDAVLKQLEADNAEVGAVGKASVDRLADSRDGVQLSIFQLDDPVLSQIRDEILHLDIDHLTPMDALNKLNDIKKILLGR